MDCFTSKTLLSVTQASERILHGVQALQAGERVDLRTSLGRVLARDVTVRTDVPSQRNSAMDGYAFCYTDSQNFPALQVVGTAFAGHPFQGELQAGQCVRIMTGAVVPDACDTVVMQEHVSREGDNIALQTFPNVGANVRGVGEDLRAGEALLMRGRKITAADLGLLASQGIAEVDVLRRVRVAFFSTGDELKSLGETLNDGEIYDSNRYTLYGMLAQLGVEIVDLGRLPDQMDVIQQTLRDARRLADVVISSGGASVGEADYIAEALRQTGAVDFWKIAMKPGKPLAFGRLGDDCLFFGLPGNPVAVMVTFLVFVRPVLLALMGESVPANVTLPAITTTPLKKAAGRTDFQRGICQQQADGTWQVQSTGMQGSHILSSMSAANCLIVLEQERGAVAVGETVTILPLAGLL